MNETSWMILTFALLGVIGGASRVLISLLGVIAGGKRISGSGSFLFLATSVVVGALCGVIIGFGNVSAFLGGYAGIDIIDGIYKRTKKISVSRK